MIRRPPRSTRTDTLFPYTTSSDLNAFAGILPEAMTMGVVGAMALAVNVAVAVMLYAFRDGDANMRSVWLCPRNDAIGTVAVMLAAVGVFGTQTASSEERRVGTECVSTCRSRWSQDH